MKCRMCDCSDDNACDFGCYWVRPGICSACVPEFAGHTAIPRDGFKVILADPPWLYKCWSKKGERKSPQRHYDCMSVKEIAALPVEAIAARDAVLFMWVTWPLLLATEALPVHGRAAGALVRGPVMGGQNVINFILREWGFEYSGLAWEWDKFNPVTGKRAFGGGYTTRKNFEPCIIARRGSPGPARVRNITDLIRAPRREHSRKPDEQYGRIEKMYKGPYLEMFAIDNARRRWKTWNPKPHREAQ